MIEDLNKYYAQEYNEDERLTKDRTHTVEFLTSVRYLDKVLQKGSKVLDACAGTGYLLKSKINDTSEENLSKWLQLHFDTCKEENLLGYSLHGLYFGIKK
jgi:hypothetical protein